VLSPGHPSETVGAGNQARLISSLDGETRFRRGLAIAIALLVPDGTPSFPIDGPARVRSLSGSVRGHNVADRAGAILPGHL